MTQIEPLLETIPIYDKIIDKILLVSGSRTIKDKEYIFKILDYTREHLFQFNTIIEGEAGYNKNPTKIKLSVDLIARMYAEERNIKLIPMRPRWDLYGINAGIIRNTDMVKIAHKGIAIWDGISKGTEDAIQKLQKVRKLISIFLYNRDPNYIDKIKDTLSKYSEINIPLSNIPQVF